MLAAWARRNSHHPGRESRGAGPSPARASSRRTVDGDAPKLSLVNSPVIRRWGGPGVAGQERGWHRLPMVRDERASNLSRFVPALGRLAMRFYDPLVRSMAREVRFKERLLDVAAIGVGELVLDVGCGTGTLAIRACQRQPAARVVGIDADPRMIERARRKADAAGAELELWSGSATDLPHAGRSCDVVLSSLLFHHLGRDAKRAAAEEIARVLVPGGRVVIVVWGAPTDPLMRCSS
jgi:SAM-dependent methyltransferase